MNRAFSQTSEDFRSFGGGITVDSQGLVVPLSKEQSDAYGIMMHEILEPLPEKLDRKVPMCKISLKKLDAEVKKIIDQFEVLPDSIRYLGGLTSIEAVIAVPESNDLILIGPAEGWKSDAAGNIVGKETGQSVLFFEDFLSIFRAWTNSAFSRGVTCSIEPAPETQTRLARLHQHFTSLNTQNADAYFAALEEAYGNCYVTIQGVPASSRFARVLIASDFKMKRIALGLEPSQVRNIPSYVSLLSSSRLNITPQFRLSAEYPSITHDSHKMAWRLGDVKIRVSPQSESGLDRGALNWCRCLEENYTALAKSQPVFGELRNNMQLTLLAALIRQENLLQKARCSLTTLANNNTLKLLEYPEPKRTAYRSVKVRNGFSTIVACGSVEINPASALRNNVRLDHTIDQYREKWGAFSSGEWSGE